MFIRDKFNPHGSNERSKARLVAQRFSYPTNQIRIDQTSAPVASLINRIRLRLNLQKVLRTLKSGNKVCSLNKFLYDGKVI